MPEMPSFVKENLETNNIQIHNNKILNEMLSQNIKKMLATQTILMHLFMMNTETQKYKQVSLCTTSYDSLFGLWRLGELYAFKNKKTRSHSKLS